MERHSSSGVSAADRCKGRLNIASVNDGGVETLAGDSLIQLGFEQLFGLRDGQLLTTEICQPAGAIRSYY